MASQRVMQPPYMVGIDNDPDTTGAIRFTFVPKGVGRITEQPPPQYILSVRGYGDEVEFHWIEPPPHELQEELQEIARQRVTIRNEWLERLGKLVATVKDWANELDWATRTVEKKIEDAEIGDYRAPGLLVQQESVRLFLEPVARSAPGAEGVVDLYLMPSYDDIASLYYYNDQWNVHYMFEGTPSVGNIRAAEPKPLTKETIQQVFDEMKSHAG